MPATTKIIKLGKVYPSRTMFFRVASGEATEDATGTKYEFSVGVGDNAPIIRNMKTGRWWATTWAELIHAAKEAGIDEEARP